MAVAVKVSRHAVRRFRERVDPSLSMERAEAEVLMLAEHAVARPRPRHSMRKVTEARTGTRYLYAATHSDICLVERESVIVTVYARAACKRMRPDGETVAPGRRQPTSRAQRRRMIAQVTQAAMVRT